jgi:CBS domain-containing protein
MNIGEQFAKEVVTAGPKSSLASVAALMDKHNVGTVVIVQDQKAVGILTDRDLALALGSRGVSPQAPVEDVMTKSVTTIDYNKGILEATWYMQGYELRRLPIVDGEGRVIGLVTMDDLLRLLTREMSNLTEGIKREMVVK